MSNVNNTRRQDYADLDSSSSLSRLIQGLEQLKEPAPVHPALARSRSRSRSGRSGRSGSHSRSGHSRSHARSRAHSPFSEVRRPAYYYALQGC